MFPSTHLHVQVKTSVMVFANTTVAMSNRCAETKFKRGTTNRVFAAKKTKHVKHCPQLFLPDAYMPLRPSPSRRIQPSLQAADAYAAAAAVRRTGSGSRRATVGVAGAVGLSRGGAVNLSGGAATEPTTTKRNNPININALQQNKGRRNVPWIRAPTTTTKASVKNVMRAIAIIVSEIGFLRGLWFECGEEECAAEAFTLDMLVLLYLVEVEWNSLTSAAMLDENPAPTTWNGARRTRSRRQFALVARGIKGIYF